MNENNTRPTQCDRIIKYLHDFGEITSAEAISDLGVYRLASRISELKKRGYSINKRMIKGKNRYGESVSWASYSLQEPNNQYGEKSES